MACYHPIPAWQAPGGGDVRLMPPLGTANLELPCGKCLGCRQAHATTWARRCEHEAHQHADNSFLTLTYNDRFLPSSGHLQPRHLQLFIKRLRKSVHTILAREAETARERSTPTPPTHLRDPEREVVSNPRSPLRYFACGEYGEQDGRPHYHLLIFNADFPGDRIGISHEKELRTSQLIEKCWSDPHTKASYGFHTVGTADAGAVAGYIAKYALKQSRFSKHHNPIADHDGVYNENWIKPPFIRISKGIGQTWLQQHAADLTRGYLVANGHQQRIPRYYKTKLKEWAQQPTRSETYELLEHYQQQYKLNYTGDKNTPERRHDAEIIHTQQHERRNNRL